MTSLRRLLGRVKYWKSIGVIFLVGSICILGSWVLEAESWFSGILIEIGATFLLFGPLLVIQKRTEKRLDDVQDGQRIIQERQDRATIEISTLSEELAQTKDELRATREQIAAKVMERLSEARQRDIATFQAVEEEISHESLFSALSRALELALIPEIGCRVELHETLAYLRFYPIEVEGGVIKMMIETGKGVEIDTLHWVGSENESVEDVLVRLAEKLQVNGLYPGDLAFNPTRVFTDLRQLLEVAYRRSTGVNGLRGPLGRVIQLCPPQWCITEDGIKTIDDMPYEIHASRFKEMDWVDHMRGKPWVDISSFDHAWQVATDLYLNGQLAVMPKGQSVEPPF